MQRAPRRFLAVVIAAMVPAPLTLSGQQSGPDLTGTIGFDASSAMIRRIEVTIGDGGSGPYPAILSGDPGLATHTIYRPRDLSPFGASNPLPIVAWGNGSCRNNSGEYRNFLSEIASHGFIVIAVGPAAHSLVLGSGEAGGGTQASQLIDGVDWAIAQHSRQGSAYEGRIAVDRIAVMGHSCGGAQALDVSKDPRVTTTVLWNSGVLNQARPAPPAAPASSAGGPGVTAGPPSSMTAMTKERLSELHGPIAYFVGGESDIAYPNAVDDFERINHVPIVFGSQDVGHYPATFRQPNGGAYGVSAVAWLKWQLKGDASAADAFLGTDCGLCSDPAWTVRTKNLR